MKPHVLAYQLLGATWWTIKDIIAVLDLSVSESSLRNWLKRCGIMNRTRHPQQGCYKTYEYYITPVLMDNLRKKFTPQGLGDKKQ